MPSHPTRRHLLLAAGLPLAGCAQPPPLQQAGWGRVERWTDLRSRHVDPRPVEVWLPPGYDEQARAGRRYAVLLMHDGQMLFDPAHTWNGKSWRMDAAARSMAGRLRDFIIVAPWNNGPLRHSEYYPEGFLPHLPPALRDEFIARSLQGRPRGDAYLRFLVDELRPAVLARCAALDGPQHWCLMGSSMGGLISAYALCEHPEVFGGAACLSTHWIAVHERNAPFPAAAVAYLARKAPPPGRVKLWTDRGTLGLDALYDEAHAQVTAQLQRQGYAPPGFVSRVLEGTGHDEDDWARRVHEPLAFLLGA